MPGGSRARARAYLRQKERELEKVHDHIDGIDCKLETPHVTIDHSTRDVQGHQRASNLIFGSRWSDTIVGGDKADCLYGRQGGDTLHGRGGDDFISGGEGTDTLNGGSGDDILIGGWGNDTIYGGADTDTVVYEHHPVRVTLSDTGPSVAEVTTPTLAWWPWLKSLLSPNHRDTLLDIENIWGSVKDDHITGNNQDNEIFGRSGNDYLNGGGGNDTLRGGRGTDYLTGGTGADHFVIDTYAGDHDIITDFNQAEGDKIDLSLFQPPSPSTGFHKTATEISYPWLYVTRSEDALTVHISKNQYTDHEVQVTLRGVTALETDDFIF